MRGRSFGNANVDRGSWLPDDSHKTGRLEGRGKGEEEEEECILYRVQCFVLKRGLMHC